MLFPTLSVSVLGFAAVACAAPQLHSRFEKDAAKREAIMPAERGLTWTPKKRQNSISAIANFNSFNDVSFVQDFSSFQQETVVIINQNEGVSLAELELQQEQELVGLIQEQLFLLQAQNFIVDNIRTNHFNSRNSNVNTVVLIVQAVSDSRSGNSNTRYFTRQLQSNSNIQEQEVIIIQESNVLNIGGSGSNSIPSGVQSAFGAQASGSANAFSNAQPNLGTYQPNLSQFQGLSSDVNLLPAGLSGFPQFNFGSQDVDPALIILPNQAAFVEFASSNFESIDQSISSAEIIEVGNSVSNII